MLFGKRNRIVKRILIVEDEPLTAFDNETMLGDAGYEIVATIDNFDEAIALMESDQIDLILSDVHLQGERTGLDLAMAARNRNIPILFVTGRDLTDDAGEHAIGCLMKPYSERTLKGTLECIEKTLAGQKAKPPKGLRLYPPKEATG
jgi:DNA-binding LytR/AlgR family response regulator